VTLYSGDTQIARVDSAGLVNVSPGDLRVRAVADGVFLNHDLGSVTLRAGERKQVALPGLASATISVRGDAYTGVRISVDDRPISGPYPAQIPRIAEGTHTIQVSWISGPFAGKELKQTFDARAGGHFLIRAVAESAEITIQRAR
jgi:hypothetical protein